MFIDILFHVCIIFCWLQPVLCGVVPQSQIDGLQYLYSSTNGPKWIWPVSNVEVAWNFSSVDTNISNPCVSNWSGVVCGGACYGSFSSTCNIVSLDLGQYNLTGTIPTQIGMLSMLVSLNLRSNSLHSTITNSLFELVQLSHLDLSANSLEGTLSTDLISLTALTYLSFFDNIALCGPLYPLLAAIPSLVHFDASYSSFTGSVPTDIAALTRVEYFASSFSRFTGTIPSQLGLLTALNLISLGGNSLHGTIPSSLGSLSKLVALACGGNSLSGTVPTSFDNLRSLEFFSFRMNDLSGPVPLALLLLPNISVFLGDEIFFTGNFDELGDAPLSASLSVLQLGYNSLTGKLPNTCSCSKLTVSTWGHSGFTGPIPECVGTNQPVLQLFDVELNRLSGTIPLTFNSLSSLVTLVIDANFLKGSLSQLQLGPRLTTVVLSDNGFTGSLPTQLFNSSVLETFIGTKNCFGGTLSDTMCAATNLQVLALAGLTSGFSCAHGNGLGGFKITPLAGTIPSCLYALPKLKQLSVSANALRGQLGNIVLGPELMSLSLSYNRLSGPIPAQVLQTSQLIYLDVAYNRLLGTVEEMASFPFNGGVDTSKGEVVQTNSAGTSLYLDNNWLSGNLPAAFSGANASVNVLNGNMFQCSGPSSLPPSDPKATRYACGSDLLDTSLLVLGGSMCIASLMLGCVWLIGRQRLWSHAQVDGSGGWSGSGSGGGEFSLRGAIGIMWHHYCLWPAMQTSEASSAIEVENSLACSPLGCADIHIQRCASSLANFRGGFLLISGITVLVFLPAFVLLKTSPDFLSQTYQYGWHMGIGYISGSLPGILLSLLWLMTIWVAIGFEHNFIDRRTAVAVVASTKLTTSPGRSTSDLLWLYAIFLVNVVVTLSTNTLYVYTIMTYSMNSQLIVLSCLVVFKLAWMYLGIVPWLQSLHTKFVMVMWTVIFNIILFPMLATMLVDSKCFMSEIVSGHTASDEYSYDVCLAYKPDYTCRTYAEHSFSVSYDAPAVYSFHCFADVLSTYIPTYVLSFAAIGMLSPTIQIVVTIVLAEGVRRGDNTLIRITKYLKQFERFPLFFLLPVQGIDDFFTRDPVTGAKTTTLRFNFYESRYNAINSVLVLALLLSFGMAYPPLALLLLCNIFISTLAYQLSVHYHAVQIRALSPACQDAWARIVVSELSIIQKVIFSSRSAVFLFSSIFASFAIFDISAMDYPVLAAVLMSMLVAGTYGAIRLSAWFRVHRLPRQHVEQVMLSVNIELVSPLESDSSEKPGTNPITGAESGFVDGSSPAEVVVGLTPDVVDSDPSVGGAGDGSAVLNPLVFHPDGM